LPEAERTAEGANNKPGHQEGRAGDVAAEELKRHGVEIRYPDIGFAGFG
jgi:hypothetical protein